MVIMVSLPFLARPDFWGELIDLVGLTILLSNDIDSLAWLRRLLGGLPSLQR